MAKQRNYSTEFKRQVVLEYLAGETLYGLSKRHDVSRNVIRLWIARYEADGNQSCKKSDSSDFFNCSNSDSI